MKIPASAVRPLVVLAVAAASVGCIVPAYAEDATATVTSDDSNHIIVDINLHDDADSSVSGSKATSSSTDENDSKTTGEAKDKKGDELKGKWWYSCIVVSDCVGFCRAGGHYRRDNWSSCRRQPRDNSSLR